MGFVQWAQPLSVGLTTLILGARDTIQAPRKKTSHLSSRGWDEWYFW